MTQETKCSAETACGTCESTGTCDPNEQKQHMEELLAKNLHRIKHRVAVMSGKGGVGKSTVAANLAVALAKLGKAVGILDADVHGPNIPKMFGVDNDRPQMGPDGMIPVLGPANIEVMSMAFLIQSEDTPVAWRGPLKHSLFQQFISEVHWGDLDYLIVDLPPGTGDEPLSIAHILGKPLWAVVVTTPQDVALLDSRKSVVFGKTLEMNVLGIIENMSGFSCPHCGERIDLFKTGGGERSAIELRVPFLGAIPIDPKIVAGGDSGVPVAFMNPPRQAAALFDQIALEIDQVITNHRDSVQ